MAKVIEFYLGGPVAEKVKPIPIEQRGKLVEFPNGMKIHGPQNVTATPYAVIFSDVDCLFGTCYSCLTAPNL